MDIKGKVAIITGASIGIGAATARVFAASGAKLALAARSTEKLKLLADEVKQQGIEAIVLPTDMRDPTQVHHMVEETLHHFGQVDVLINNAGQAVAGRIEELSLDDYRAVIDLNVFGPLAAMQAAIPAMRRQGRGIIVNVSSMVSKMSIPGLAGYASTKSALNMLSETARGELANDNILVITVYPRLTATDFGKNSLGQQQQRHHQRTSSPIPVDTAELVAEKILAAVQNEVSEQYMDQ
jgi:short-subunit dehydrogenase